jgi:sugar lactone lactonase YvrE
VNLLIDNGPAKFPGHDGGQWEPVPWEVVATWPAGYFAENLAIDGDGTVFVSLHSHKRIERYDVATRATTTFARLPAPATGLAFDANEILWVTGGTVGKTPGFVWRVDRAGAVEEWLQIPEAVFLNGCAMHPDGTTLLICESTTGRVLAVDQQRPSSSAWITDDLLRPENAQMPGVNGIKVSNGTVWLSVTDRSVLLRVPINADGSAGAVQVAAQKVRADDFAIAQSGALYIATHPAQTVMRLARDGTRTTIAGPDEGAVGSTACAFGRAISDENALYVTTNGGLSSPYRGVVQEAKLLRLEVSDEGQ